MERAIYIVRTQDLHYVDHSYTRLYFGHEFCERRLPSPSDLDAIVLFVKNRGMDFSFVTPYVTDLGIKKTENLLQSLKKRGMRCEVIVNDFGILNLLHRRYRLFTPVLGRLLTKQKRSPELPRLLARRIRPKYTVNSKDSKQAVLIMQKKLPPEMDFYYKGSNTSSVPLIHGFLIDQRIHRIELDNTVQGLRLELPRDKIAASVYLPYVYITTTFYCPSAGCEDSKKNFHKIKPCRQQCQRYVFGLRHKSMPGIVYLRGNTQFYKNEQTRLDEWESAGIDRLVYQPTIPV